MWGSDVTFRPSDLQAVPPGKTFPADVRRSAATLPWPAPSQQELESGFVNAGSRRYGDRSDTNETRIQRAIDQVAGDANLVGVIIPGDWTFDASPVTFDTAVRMVREGNIAPVCDVAAYGGAIDGSTVDDAAWQAAVHASEAGLGPVVWVGTSVISSQIDLASNVSIIGHGWGVSVIKPNASFPTNDRVFRSETTSETNWTLKYFEIDGSAVVNGGVDGVQAEGVSDSVISYLFIHGVTRHGINVSGASTDGSGGDNNLITGNLVRNFGSGSLGIGILCFRGASDNRIEENRVEASESVVCFAADDWSSSNSFSASRNEFTGNTADGGSFAFVVSGCHRTIVSDNICNGQDDLPITVRSGNAGDNTRSDIQPEQVRIECNIIKNVAGTVQVCISASGCIDLSIVHNTIDTASPGIRVDEELGRPEGVLIEGNVIHVVTPDDDTIQIQSGERIKVAENVCRGGRAIFCRDDDANSADILGLEISRNTIIDAGSWPIRVRGLSTTNTITGVVIEHNILWDWGSNSPGTITGILIDSDATNPVDGVEILNNIGIDPLGTGNAGSPMVSVDADATNVRAARNVSRISGVSAGNGPGLPSYSPSNVTTDRTYDADSTSQAELADVLGTLITDLQNEGYLN